MPIVLQPDADTFRDRLLPDEQILWSSRPGQGVMFAGRDVFMIPFSLLWCGFAVFWEYTVSTAGAPGFFRLWGIPFVAAGLYLVAGRFLLDSWIRRRMSYAVTNQRILILRPPPFGSFVAVELRRLPDATLNEHAGGRGTIRFGAAVNPWGRYGWSAWTPALDQTPQFLAIDDVRRVFDLIQRQAANRG